MREKPEPDEADDTLEAAELIAKALGKLKLAPTVNVNPPAVQVNVPAPEKPKARKLTVAVTKRDSSGRIQSLTIEEL